MLTEQHVVLEQEAMPGVGIEDELSVGQALRQHKRVHGRDDEVVAPARDQHRLRNFAQARVGRVLALIPAGQGRALHLDPRAGEKRIALAFPCLESFPVGHSGRLTRWTRLKEEPERSVPGCRPRHRVQNRRIEVLGALAFAWTGPRQDEATHPLGVL